MAHLRKGADGHLLKNAAGHLVKTCESVAGADCGYCTNDYHQYQITVSGVGYLYNCQNSLQINSMPPTVNGIWVVTQLAGTPCEWRYDDNAGGFGTIYTSSCNSNLQNLDYFRIRLIKISSTVWYLRFAYRTTSDYSGYLAFPFIDSPEQELV